MRLRATVLTLCLVGSLLAVGAASARNGALVLDRGIVQSVSSSQLVLRALDGSTITITVGPRTKVFLNDSPASLSSIQPGFVAGALHDGNRPAVYVRAIGRAPIIVDKGVITFVSSTSVSLRTGAGIVVIPVGSATSVTLNGQSASIGDLRPGYAADVTHRGSEQALSIRARGIKR